MNAAPPCPAPDDLASLRLFVRATEPERLDPRIVEELYARHARGVFGYLLTRIGGDRHLAEDLLQEVFLRAWRTPPDVLGLGVDACRAWLVQVARNLAIDRLRSKCRRPSETGEEMLARIPEQRCEIDRVVTSMALREALAALTPRRREVLVRMYFQGHTAKQIADDLDVPVGTVKSRVAAALSALRAELDMSDGSSLRAA